LADALGEVEVEPDFKGISSDLREEAAEAPDPRQSAKAARRLPDMPVAALLAILRGANPWGGLARFAGANAAGIRFSATGDTFQNTFSRIDDNIILRHLGGFLSRLSQAASQARRRPCQLPATPSPKK
jgi:hypothetical protein